MNVMTGVEAATAVSASEFLHPEPMRPKLLDAAALRVRALDNSYPFRDHRTAAEVAGAVALGERRAGPRGRWDDARVAQLCALLRDGKTYDEVAKAMEVKRGCIAAQVMRMRHRGDDRLPPIRKPGARKGVSRQPRTGPRLARFDPIRARGRGVVLDDNHPAVREARPLFAGRVKAANDVKNVLISGHNNRKIGGIVVKGPRRGWPIVTLTLPERATCPHDCAAFNACYGNGMNWALRVAPGAALEDRLWDALGQLNARHPRGFLVRLHVLGDFYSEEYVEFWVRALDAFPALHVFGFTARNPDHDEIGNAVWAVAALSWERFAVRFSGIEGATHASRIVEHGEKDPEAITCPAATGASDRCATCGLCFHPSFTGSIAFPRH